MRSGMQEGNVPRSMSTSTKQQRQRGGQGSNIIKYANDKCHMVIVMVNLVGHWCNLRYAL